MYDNQVLYKTLQELKVIDTTQLNRAFTTAQNQKKALGDILLDKNLISEENLGKLIADLLSVPFIQLSEVDIPNEILLIIPEADAKQHRIVAFKKDTKGLHVAMENPTNKEVIYLLQKKIGIPVIPYLTTQRDITKTLGRYLMDISKAFEEVINKNFQYASGKKHELIEPPIIKIVETIIFYAYKNNASDIHLEVGTQNSLVRFRIDGKLIDIIRFPLDIYLQIVMRIKVIAEIRTDERQIPQDGKITIVISDSTLDIRVSTVPVEHGEKIVMRLLSEREQKISLQSLGFSQIDLTKIVNAYQKPYGMILSTGPTGSGKTTTMYAILKLLNNRDVNIMTIEDPTEYDVEGINQIQVNTDTNLTFATGLRSILRQDPNIIFVGEIRDKETADIAINAAMTGQLVLSTLHTNDAATAVPRLIDLGIEPFLISSTVNCIIAQRLVRKVHSVCRVSREVTLASIERYINPPVIKKIFGSSSKVRLYKGKGCQLCHNSGYEGRMGIFEIMEINDAIKQAIIEKNSATIIKNLAIKNGMQTMLEDGLGKVKSGETSLEEVLRVTKA
jgi:type IV pilus assembly protein PilB